jgi:hypothetical protein
MRRWPVSYLSSAYAVLDQWISNEDSRSYRDQIESHYGALYEISGGDVSEEGVFTFEHDPPLEPLITYSRNEEKMYVYRYAIVAFISEKETFVSRID